MAKPTQYYLAYGGGLGDVLWDYLRDVAATRVAMLVEEHGCQIRVITQCHNDGVRDLFLGHPYIQEHQVEEWRPPTYADAVRFSQPIDGFLPLQHDQFFCPYYGTDYRRAAPEIHLSAHERSRLAGLLVRRPCIVVQPFAGLSCRDAFDAESLRLFVREVAARNAAARVLVVGHNHDRGGKTFEALPFTHPNMDNLLDKLGIRLAYHLVRWCDAFVGSHSNLIRTAWDWRRRSACVLPDPFMTRIMSTLDPKYRYGFDQPESRIFTYPFTEGAPQQFGGLDVAGLADHVLGGQR